MSLVPNTIGYIQRPCGVNILLSNSCFGTTGGTYSILGFNVMVDQYICIIHTYIHTPINYNIKTTSLILCISHPADDKIGLRSRKFKGQVKTFYSIMFLKPFLKNLLNVLQ